MLQRLVVDRFNNVEIKIESNITPIRWCRQIQEVTFIVGTRDLQLNMATKVQPNLRYILAKN